MLLDVVVNEEQAGIGVEVSAEAETYYLLQSICVSVFLSL